jgi:hypothetical protein
LLLDQLHAVPGPGRVVALLDQQPWLLARRPAAFHAHQRPSAVKLAAVEPELEMALAIVAARVAARLPGAAVPEHDRSGAILFLRDDSFELAVFERMILDMNCEPLVRRIEAWALRDRPALERPVELEPEVVVHATSRMLLDYKAQSVRGAARFPSARLGRLAEIALVAVLLQAHEEPRLRAA